MTYNEFQQKDLELLAMIANYRMSSEDARRTIALNEKECIKLEQQRTELRYAYAAGNDPFIQRDERQRNLKGEFVS